MIARSSPPAIRVRAAMNVIDADLDERIRRAPQRGEDGEECDFFGEGRCLCCGSGHDWFPSRGDQCVQGSGENAAHASIPAEL
jgi:hypothetical protein